MWLIEAIRIDPEGIAFMLLLIIAASALSAHILSDWDDT